MASDRRALLDVRDLSVAFARGTAIAADRVSFRIGKGETVALVGESGSGKTVSALSILRLLPYPAASHPSGEVWFEGKNLLKLKPPQLQAVRGDRISMIFQEPMTSLNPLHTIERQVGEVLRVHRRMDEKAVRARVLELLNKVGIREPEKRLNAFPHQLSGGQRQRVMIAMALANEPDLLIADEPTTALDVTIQAQILDLLLTLQRERGMALVLITHNIGVVAETASRVAVMYAGQVMEEQAANHLFSNPQHPYTQALLAALPERAAGGRLATIPGMVPGPYDRPGGCLFSPRCAYATDHSRAERPALRPWNGGHIRCHYPLGDPSREQHRMADELHSHAETGAPA
jgi:dipeptide transport system ATP-binding protein